MARADTRTWRDYAHPVPGRFWTEFHLGFCYLGEGYRFLQQNKKLWWYALPPIIAYLPVFFVFLDYFPWFLGWTGGSLFNLIRPFWEFWWGQVLIVLILLFAVLPIVFLALFFVALLVLLATLIASIFNDLLAEETEALRRGQRQVSPFSLSRVLQDAPVVVLEEIKKLGFYLAVQAVLLVLAVFPLIGQVAYLVVAGLFTLIFLGFEYVDYSLARRLVPFGEKWSLVVYYKWRILGFGTAVSLAFLVPLLNVVAIGFSVVGATLIFVDLGIYRTRGQHR